jgi:Fur family transcriptional regulator, ferric uptake regulator
MNSVFNVYKIALANNGYRMTQARRVVLEALLSAGGHVSADGLVDLVHGTGIEVGRMTVYRTLDLLTELGLVRPVYQGTGAAHYILLVNGRHHHFVCTRCHAIVEVDTCFMSNLDQEIEGLGDFEIQGHLLEVYGVCPNCQDDRS